MASTTPFSTPPSTGNHPPSHNGHSSSDNGNGFTSSPPQGTPAYDCDPFNDFVPHLANFEAQQRNGSEEQLDLPEDGSQSPQSASTSPFQLPSFPGIVEMGVGQPDPFCQIDQVKEQYSQDEITQIMNVSGGQSRGVAEDLLDDVEDQKVMSRVVRQQQAAANAPRTQASQYPSLSANPVVGNANRSPESGGYQELPESDETLPGMRLFAAFRDPATVGASNGDVGRNVYDNLQHAFNQTSHTSPVNQQPQEGYVPAGDDEDDDEESSEREDTPTAKPTTRRRRCGNTYTPRARGNRRKPSRSDPHRRFLSTDQVAITDAAHTHTIDRRTHESGRNLMALYDGSDTPRTRYRLRIESGRTGQHANAAYPESNQEIPARLSLRQICQQYPNHVWGTGLRLFMHEAVTAEQIWKSLPDNVRMNGCKGRPWNYLQQAIGRQCDEMMEEETGEKRQVMKRKHDDDDDEDEEEDRKPKTKKTATTPGGRPLLAPAPGPNQLPFPQRSQMSPFAAQAQQGRVGPRGVIQRPATANTPVPTAGVVRGQPSPSRSPPRTASDLRRFIATERAIQADILAPILVARYGQLSEQDMLMRLRAWHNNTNTRFVNRVIQTYNLAANPVPNNDLVGLILWLLARGAKPPAAQAEDLAVRGDHTSIALNWQLYVLREVTEEIGRGRAVEGAEEA